VDFLLLIIELFSLQYEVRTNYEVTKIRTLRR